MNKYRLNINGKEVTGVPGQTILEVARENGIFIPTLCYDRRTRIYGSCGLCMCEVEGNPKLCKACATEIAPNMVVNTQTERVVESRKTNLELLLSNHAGDCRPPCVLACPAQTDCQGYVGLIANGEYEEAIALIKDKLPIPASLGRVCPHPCEKDCRRGLMDEPISIMHLKRFASDQDMLTGKDVYLPECRPDTGKSVAVIGGGPLGLSAAYFLRQKGHAVTIYESMPKAGGMLRYGIPEYRLPNEILDMEIDTIKAIGVEIVSNTKVGVDLPFAKLYDDHDAVLLSIGAWVSTGVGCKGEDAEGVIGGIDFLRRVVRNEEIKLGERVAIVGGGNTAMDACRTAVRLGAKEVYNIYRRTKDEMPADRTEIEEAEEEGVIFKNLTNPMEVIKDENGRVKELLLQVMELGEPDESGRRKPVPVEGKTETIPLDTMILAIGQAVDASLFDCEKTKRGGVVYDPKTMMTSVPGVFAGGDCGNDKISIAVEAVADARKAADSIDAYLNGEEWSYEQPYYVTRDDISEKTFEDRERECRPGLAMLSAEEREDNFTEVVYQPYTPEEAEKEANRCLECGCHDYFECKLIDLAHQYDVKPDRFGRSVHEAEVVEDHPFIVMDPNKCVLCGLCVRVCDEVMGVGALGLVNRGFDTVVRPNMEKPLLMSGCISCGQCASICPTGAIQEKTTMIKETPVSTYVTDTVCSYCSVGCALELETCGNMLIKARPGEEGAVNAGLICAKGKWGFDTATLEGKLESPLIKDGDGFRETDYHEALVLAAKKCQSIGAKYGKSSVAVAISDRYTNEEAYAMKRMAAVMGAKVLCLNNRASGIKPVLGFDASPNTIDELLSTEVILAASYSAEMNPVIQLKLRQAAQNGAKVVLINPESLPQDMMNYLTETVYTENTLDFLKQLAKAVAESGRGKDLEGFAEFEQSVASAKVSEEAKRIADLYLGAKKAMIVFTQNTATVEAATLLANIALASGHIGKPRDGILQIKSKNNSQGIVDMGIRAGAEALEGVKAVISFGEDSELFDRGQLEFLAVCDTHLTETAARADVVIPGTGFASADGTYTNTERRLQAVNAAVVESVELSNWEIAAEIATVFEVEFGWRDVDDISAEMCDVLPTYKYAEVGEVLGGALAPTEMAKLVAVGDGRFVEQLAHTDSLMRATMARIPEAVKATADYVKPEE